ncbi:hypothetical protein A2U01_0020679, partial [Trifolium medium]|nr:hypothetical protein [Trifolium medium]
MEEGEAEGGAGPCWIGGGGTSG